MRSWTCHTRGLRSRRATGIARRSALSEVVWTTSTSRARREAARRCRKAAPVAARRSALSGPTARPMSRTLGSRGTTATRWPTAWSRSARGPEEKRTTTGSTRPRSTTCNSLSSASSAPPSSAVWSRIATRTGGRGGGAAGGTPRGYPRAQQTGPMMRVPARRPSGQAHRGSRTGETLIEVGVLQRNRGPRVSARGGLPGRPEGRPPLGVVQQRLDGIGQRPGVDRVDDDAVDPVGDERRGAPEARGDEGCAGAPRLERDDAEGLAAAGHDDDVGPTHPGVDAGFIERSDQSEPVAEADLLTERPQGFALGPVAADDQRRGELAVDARDGLDEQVEALRRLEPADPQDDGAV